MLTLTNKQLTAHFLLQGAELIALKDHEGNDYLMRDDRYWGYTSPHLFPVVGMLRESALRHKGKDYPQKRHGFARNMEFQVVYHEENTLIFELVSNEETKKLYPFEFLLRVIYSLQGSSLSVTYEVINRSEEPMPFSIGAHPAFWVPFHKDQNFTDYTLVFEKEEHLERIPIDITTGLLKKPKELFLEKSNTIPLHKDLFKDDALIFENLKSTYISIVSNHKTGSVRFHFKNFPFLGIWTTEDSAPFLCLEPWAGHADYEDFTGEFLAKEDNVILMPEASEKFTYSIEIL